jgi:periplasmic divalent cation tolerance protein
MTDHVVVSTTIDSEDAAAALARGIVAARLGACVQMVPVRSFYRWGGAVQETGEWRLEVKAAQSQLAPLIEHLGSHHPYDLPEVVATPIVGGSAGYLAWLDAEAAGG